MVQFGIPVHGLWHNVLHFLTPPPPPPPPQLRGVHSGSLHPRDYGTFPDISDSGIKVQVGMVVWRRSKYRCSEQVKVQVGMVVWRRSKYRCSEQVKVQVGMVVWRRSKYR